MRRVNYGTVGIVGLGLMGASIGLRLKQIGATKKVIGFDISPEVRRIALERGAVDNTYETLNRLGDADILILAVPPNQVISCLVEADVFCKVNCIVTDTSSVKTQVISWIDSYPLRFSPRFVGGHPMAGTEHTGPEHAKADMFEGKYWILTPTEATDKGALEAIKSLVITLGAHPILLSPEEHDRHAAILSHLPHALAGSLSLMAANLTHPEIAGPSWKDLTRVAGSNPELWTNIFSNNREQVVSAIEDLIFMLQQLKSAVDREQIEEIKDFFESSGKAKSVWEK